MNKRDIVQKVAKKLGINQSTTYDVLAATLEIISDAVAQGNKVTLVGFGVFERRDRAPRLGRNPQTSEPMQIPATRTPAFFAGKNFKDKVISLAPED